MVSKKKATSMDERFQRIYLRSCVQVIELDLGEAVFPLFK